MSLSKQAFAPLYLWGAVFLLVGLFFSGLYTAFYFDKVQDSEEASIVAKLPGEVAAEWAQVQPGKPLIVAVGSSLLHNGFDVKPLKNRDYQSLVFYRPNGAYDNFGQFFQQSLHHKPVLIIIQTDLFFIRNDKSLPVFLKESRALVGELIRKTAGLPIMQPADFSCQPLSEPAYRGWFSQFSRLYSRVPEEQTGLVQWIRVQQKRGIKVVLLDIPRSPSSESALGVMQKQWRQNINKLAKQLKLDVLHYPGALSDADFCDGNHMTSTGGAVHTRWLDGTIQRLLRELA